MRSDGDGDRDRYTERCESSVRTGGHDVGALDEEPALDREHELELAKNDASILATHNVADVRCILGEWLSTSRSHSDVILVHGIEHTAHELVAGGVGRWLSSARTRTAGRTVGARPPASALVSGTNVWPPTAVTCLL